MKLLLVFLAANVALIGVGVWAAWPLIRPFRVRDRRPGYLDLTRRPRA